MATSSTSGPAAASTLSGSGPAAISLSSGLAASEHAAISSSSKIGKAYVQRPTPFQKLHATEFGLKVSQRDPSNSGVLAVACQFCVAFGRECEVDAKRKQHSYVKVFAPLFRKENYRSHFLSDHPIKWSEYYSSSTAKKSVFFEIDVPFANTIEAHMNLDSDAMTVVIEKDIIEIILGEMYMESG